MLSTQATPSSLGFLSVIRDNMTIYIPDNLCPLNVFILVLLIYGTMDCRTKPFPCGLCYVYPLLLIPWATVKSIKGSCINWIVTQRLVMHSGGNAPIMINSLSLKCPVVISIRSNPLFPVYLFEALPWRELPQFPLSQRKEKKRKEGEMLFSPPIGLLKGSQLKCRLKYER